MNANNAKIYILHDLSCRLIRANKKCDVSVTVTSLALKGFDCTQSIICMAAMEVQKYEKINDLEVNWDILFFINFVRLKQNVCLSKFARKKQQ